MVFVEGKYVITGETFNFEGESRGTFHSKYSEYRNFSLELAFEGLTSSIEKDQNGNCEFKFIQTGSISKKFIGNIYNNVRNHTIRIIAIKLDDSKVKKLDIEEEKQLIIKGFIEKRRLKEKIKGIDNKSK